MCPLLSEFFSCRVVTAAVSLSRLCLNRNSFLARCLFFSPSSFFIPSFFHLHREYANEAEAPHSRGGEVAKSKELATQNALGGYSRGVGSWGWRRRELFCMLAACSEEGNKCSLFKEPRRRPLPGPTISSSSSSSSSFKAGIAKWYGSVLCL